MFASFSWLYATVAGAVCHKTVSSQKHVYVTGSLLAEGSPATLGARETMSDSTHVKVIGMDVWLPNTSVMTHVLFNVVKLLQ